MVSSSDRLEIKDFLEEKYRQYASKSFIDDDPIQIPHRFHNSHDIEISGLLTATLAWGNRSTIICSTNNLMNRMDNSPFEFVTNFSKNDYKYLNGFVHRTFDSKDCIEYIRVLRSIYLDGPGLKNMFIESLRKTGTIKSAITEFRNCFVRFPVTKNVLIHVPDVESGSAAKRINMFLRWMVRSSKEGIDFGIWNEIPLPSLMVPLDTHSGRVARSLGLLSRKRDDWKAVEELKKSLQEFDHNDPVKYDFALFGLGVYEKFGYK